VAHALCTCGLFQSSSSILISKYCIDAIKYELPNSVLYNFGAGGFVKKTQATPIKELRLAKQRMKEVLND
jgi:hypothetical protein